MKLIIMGASGNVGQMIVPVLAKLGVDLLLLGRDKGVLSKLYPNHKVASNSQLEELAVGYEGLLYLSILNNDKNGTQNEFENVNINFLEQTLDTVSKTRLNFFLYPTSLHASSDKNSDHYSKTKKAAENLLQDARNVNVRILSLPAVYGTKYSGRLSILYKFPKFARGLIFNILRSFKPTVNIRKVANAVMDGENNKNFAIITDRQEGNWFYNFVVKLIDIGFVIFVVAVLWWLILLCMMLIKLSSSGPAIFKQERVGRYGKSFIFYKLRTMKIGTVQLGTHEVSTDNITKFGHFLRKSKIDELPQLFNILKGEMCLIGPRPCLTNQVEIIKARDKRSVFDHKPGITGWSQVRSIAMKDPEKLAKSDEYFLQLQTLPMLFGILFSTVFRRR